MLDPDKLENWPNFPLEPWGELGAISIRKGLRDFHSATLHVWKLPYHRTDNPYDFTSVLKEGFGTCSTKHTFLAALAREHGLDNLQLEIIVFRMHKHNTPSLAQLLESYNMEAIPEAHTRLIWHEKAYDFTYPHTNLLIAPEDILEIHIAYPSQMPLYKDHIHKNILAQWSQRYGYDPDIMWKLREACIEHLQKNYRAL